MKISTSAMSHRTEPQAWLIPAQLFKHSQLQGCLFVPGQPQVFQNRLSLPACLNQAAPKRQTEYLAGRWCVQQVYQQLGLALPLPEYQAQAAPHWPAGWLGSISHTQAAEQGYAVAALASLSEVQALGLDLEATMSEGVAERVRNNILHPDEQRWVQTPAQLSLIFSFKESLYKAFNPILQRFIGFQEVVVTALETEGQVHFEPWAELKQDLPAQAPRQGSWQHLEPLWLTAYEWSQLG